MKTLLQDIQLALRGFAKAPGFTLLAVLTLALGLGANTAIFGVLDAAVLRPLPFPDPDKLVTIHLLAQESRSGSPDLFPWSYPKFERFRQSAQGFTAIAGYSGPTNLNLVSPEGPERLAAEEVSGTYFEVLGLEPAAGRLFLPAYDKVPGEPAAVVLSHHLWQSRFGAEPRIIGTTLRFDGRALTVTGVAPPGFRGLSGGADVFVPITLAPFFEYDGILTEAGNHWLLAVGRLKRGTSHAAARAEAARVGAIVDREYRFPEQAAPWSAAVRELANSRVDPGFRRSVWLLAGAVGLVLLIACVNLTSLLLVRAVGRRREMAVRLALGAGRGRLVRQVLTETLLLSLGGWLLGLLAASGAVQFLSALAANQAPSGNGVSYFFDPAAIAVDGRISLFALALTLVAAAVAGILPAVQASRPGLTEALKGSPPVIGVGRLAVRRPGIQQALVTAEIALALILLVGAGLLLHSFSRLHALDPGIDPAGVLTVRYAGAEGDLAQREPTTFRQTAITRLAALPGVSSASIGLCPPLGPRCSGSVVNRVDGQTFRIGSGGVRIGLHPVSPDHFRTLGIPIIRGRAITDQDRPGTPRVVVLNETAARRLFPGQDPIGHRMAAATFYFAGGDSAAEVIGIAKDVRYGAYDAEAEPDLYYPMSYLARFGSAGTLFLKGDGDPLRLVDLVKAELRSIDPNLPTFRVMSMEQLAGAALARPRFAATLLGAFAAVALVLAALGLYGVLAFVVAQRTRELGVRMALGATEFHVLGGVLRQGLTLAAAGIGLGLLGAFALQRVMSGLLYDVQPTDPLSLAGASLLLAAAAGLAALIPARRATRADPLVALRSE